MRPCLYLSLKQPVSVLEKGLHADAKGLFKGITKAVMHLGSGKPAELIGDAGDILASLGVTAEPGEVAWVLVQRALGRAMLAIAFEANLALGENLTQLTPVSQTADSALNAVEVEVSPDFFQKPRQSPVLEVIKPLFADWLIAGGMASAAAKNAADRLPGYFVFALGEEWNSAPDGYKTTLAATTHPFAQAGEWEMAWLRYNAYLQKQIDTGLFNLPFSLRQLYIPLRASFEVKDKNAADDDETERIYAARRKRDEEKKRVLVDLQAELDQWVAHPRRDDAVRLVHGGPGSGKSSFLKMYAAHRAEIADSPRVLYVPLHLIDHKGDLEQALGEFFRQTKLLPSNTFSAEGRREPLLILFDGLDELALQGKLGAESANAFTQEVLRKVDLRNSSGVEVQVILSGRDVAVQACAHAFRKQAQILNVEPYLIDAKAFVEQRTPDTTDQRTRWWQNYGERSGRDYAGIPEELQGNEKLDDITKYPLLNHLVALSYGDGNRDFSNLNSVYKNLLQGVYRRDYEQNKTHQAVSKLTEPQFLRVMEEIALTAWHSRGRTTTVREIEEQGKRFSVLSLLRQFRSDKEEGRVADLLLAFYFRQAGNKSDGDAAYEFTHKSFGEYLTACRIVRGIDIIYKQMRDRAEDVDRGWDNKQALAHWVELCGPTALDRYLLTFLRDEVALRDKYLPQWQKALTILMNHLLRYGLPMEDCKNLTYKDMTRQARNATEALLAAINACVRANPEAALMSFNWFYSDTDAITELNFASARAFLDMLRGEMSGVDTVFLNCLRKINLDACSLSSTVLLGADLQGASLQGASFYSASCFKANLREAHLRDCTFYKADLAGADLRLADLSSSDLGGADLSDADLRGANLCGADLSSAIVDGAKFEGSRADDSTVWPLSFVFGTDNSGYEQEQEEKGNCYLLRWKGINTESRPGEEVQELELLHL